MVQEWSHVRKDLSACEKMPGKKTQNNKERNKQQQKSKSLMTQFLQITELFLDHVFVLLQGIAGGREFASDSLL